MQLQQHFVVITTPLIKLYSKQSIEKELAFSIYNSIEMQYSIRYPEHWSLIPKGNRNPNTVVLFQPPFGEGGAQELSIVSSLFLFHFRLQKIYHIQVIIQRHMQSKYDCFVDAMIDS